MNLWQSLFNRDCGLNYLGGKPNLINRCEDRCQGLVTARIQNPACAGLIIKSSRLIGSYVELDRAKGCAMDNRRWSRPFEDQLTADHDELTGGMGYQVIFCDGSTHSNGIDSDRAVRHCRCIDLWTRQEHRFALTVHKTFDSIG